MDVDLVNEYCDLGGFLFFNFILYFLDKKLTKSLKAFAYENN